MFTSTQLQVFGLIALAGAASNNVKQRESLQNYLDSGLADDACDFLGTPRSSFLDSVDELAAVITTEFQIRDRIARNADKQNN